MKIHGTLTAQDLSEARYAVGLRMFVAVTLMTWLLINLVLSLCGGNTPLALWTRIAVSLLFIVLLFLRQLRTIYPSRDVRLQEAESLRVPRDIDLSSDGLSISGSPVPIQAAWTQVSKFMLTKNAVILFFPSASYEVIPLRWFAADQLAEFQSILKAGAVKRALLSEPLAS